MLDIDKDFPVLASTSSHPSQQQQQQHLVHTPNSVSSPTTELTTVSATTVQSNANEEVVVEELSAQDVIKMTEERRLQLSALNKRLESLYKDLKNVFGSSGNDKDDKRLEDVKNRLHEYKTTITTIRKKSDELEKKKEQFREDRDGIKEQVEVLRNKALLATQEKEKKEIAFKSRQKTFKKQKKRLNDMKKQLPHLNIAQYDEEIATLQKQNAEENAAKIQELKHLRTNCQNYINKWDKQVTEQSRLNQMKEEVSQADKDIEENEKTRKALTKTYTDMKEDESLNEQIVHLKKELRENSAKLREAKEEKKKILDEYKNKNQASFKKRQEIKELIKAAKSKKLMLTEEADQWSSLLVTHKVQFKPAMFRLLLSSANKIADQTRAKINILRDVSTVSIRGTEESAGEALQLIQQLLQDKHREATSVRFKPELLNVLLARDQLKQLKKDSKATSLYVDKLAGTIKIEAESQSALNHSKKYIEQFLEQNVQDSTELKFNTLIGESDLDAEIFKGVGNLLRSIREETQVNRIFVERDRKIIEISGRKTSVQKAREAIVQLFEQLKDSKQIVKLQNSNQAKSLIGKAGVTLRKIENETKTVVSVDSVKLTATIRGSKENVQKAKEVIDQGLQTGFSQAPKEKKSKEPSEKKEKIEKKSKKTSDSVTEEKKEKPEPKYKFIAELQVDQNGVDKLLGAKGEELRRIKQESGAKVLVLKKDTKVLIKAETEESLSKAKELLQGTLPDAVVLTKAPVESETTTSEEDSQQETELVESTTTIPTPSDEEEEALVEDAEQ